MLTPVLKKIMLNLIQKREASGATNTLASDATRDRLAACSHCIADCLFAQGGSRQF